MRTRHLRTALFVVLALVLAAGVAACGSKKKSSSTTVSGQPGKGKPAVKLGTKNFPESFILGQLYKQALEAKGYTVQFKNNIGSTEIIDKALTSGQINVYPEYTGEIVLTVEGQKQSPKTADATYAAAKAFQEKRGATLLADPKAVFGFQNVAPVVKKSVLSQEGPAFAQTMNAVSAKLTLEAMRKMNGAVSLDKQDPAKIADQFLRANGLK